MPDFFNVIKGSSSLFGSEYMSSRKNFYLFKLSRSCSLSKLVKLISEPVRCHPVEKRRAETSTSLFWVGPDVKLDVMDGSLITGLGSSRLSGVAGSGSTIRPPSCLCKQRLRNALIVRKPIIIN